MLDYKTYISKCKSLFETGGIFALLGPHGFELDETVTDLIKNTPKWCVCLFWSGIISNFITTDFNEFMNLSHKIARFREILQKDSPELATLI